jgi:hypothetical protein
MIRSSLRPTMTCSSGAPAIDSTGLRQISATFMATACSVACFTSLTDPLPGNARPTNATSSFTAFDDVTIRGVAGGNQ